MTHPQRQGARPAWLAAAVTPLLLALVAGEPLEASRARDGSRIGIVTSTVEHGSVS